ncbi:MAG: hypothetical protein ABWK05_02085 [Pyrobaculum sp.]
MYPRREDGRGPRGSTSVSRRWDVEQRGISDGVGPDPVVPDINDDLRSEAVVAAAAEAGANWRPAPTRRGQISQGTSGVTDIELY